MTSTFRSLLILSLLCLTQTMVSAQKGKHTLAQQRMHEFDYDTAAEIYEDILNKNKYDVLAVRNAGICRAEQSQSKEAEAHFQFLVDSTGGATFKDYILLANVLKRNQKYDEAHNIYLRMDTLFIGNPESEKYLANPNWAHVLLRDSSLFHIAVSEVSSPQSDFGPNFSFTERIIFSSARGEGKGAHHVYARNDQSYLNLYIADIKEDSTLTNPILIETDWNSRFHESMVAIDKTTNTAYMTRNYFADGLKSKGEDGYLNLAIFYAQKNGDEWGKIHEFPYNNPEYSVGHPTVSEDGQFLYFASNMPGGFGKTDIYVCEKDSTGAWTKPKNMGPVVNTLGEEAFPFIHPENRLYFASDGHMGLGGLDIYYANLDFSLKRVRNVSYPVNTCYDDFGLIMYEDGRRGYFSSNRPGGMGDDDIYEYLNVLPETITINGYVTDIDTDLPIPTGIIFLRRTSHEDVWEEVSNTDETGFYSFQADFELEYTLKASAPGYFPFEREVYPSGLSAFMEDIDFKLKKIDYYARGEVIYAETESPASGAILNLIDEQGNTLDSQITGANGSYEIGLLKDKKYLLKCSKEGYPDQSVALNTIGRKDSVFYNVFRLFKLEVGVEVEVDDIFYDYDKADIRPDAAEKLDRLVSMLNENPQMEIELSSHTDCRGSASYNMSLSKRRAKSAVDYMVSQGISASRLTSKGYGETKLKNRCADGVQCSEDEHQQNRRTMFTITKL